MSAPATPHIDYEQAAESYARHRGVHPGVLAELIAGGALTADSRVLDVGCGTGNYARSLKSRTGCRLWGVEPSAEMRSRAATVPVWEALTAGSAESLPFPDGSFDLVFSTDVIHHVGDRHAFFREAARVLVPGGRIATVTDSHADLARRRPLTSHFPETLPIERQRYPDITTLDDEMRRAGFVHRSTSEVALEYELTDLQPYRDRAFSSLRIIDDAAFQRGLARLEADLARGPVPALSLYTILWGSLPR